jgi:hypothetical protein
VNIVPTVCPYGCRYFNDGWHAENCPGNSVTRRAPAERPAFLSEPEYEFERQADETERRREEAEDVRTIYPEKGLTDG